MTMTSNECNPPLSIVESRLYWIGAVLLMVLPFVLPIVALVW